jgi:cell division protein FtsB
MKVDLGIWDRLTRLILFLIVLAGLAAVVVWYLPLIKRNERMRKEVLQLDTLIEQEAQQARKLKADIDAQRDPRTVERLARERLNYTRTNETVIRFQAPATNPPSASPGK